MKKNKRSNEDRNTYLRLLRYIKPHSRIFILAVICTALYGASDGAIPYLLQKVLDDIFLEKDKSALWLLVYGVVAFGLLRAIFGFCQRYLTQVISLRIVRDLRNEISEKMLYLPCEFFSDYNTGSLVSRMTNDTLVVKQAISDASMSIVKDSIRVLVLLGAALYLDPYFAFIVLVAVPIAVFPIIKFGKKVRSHSKSGQDEFGSLTSVLEEHITGHKIVKAFGQEAYAQSKFMSTNQISTKFLEKAAKYGSLHSPLNELLAGLAVAGVLLYGGTSVMDGAKTQGDFIAFISSIFLLYEPLKKLGKLNTTLQTGVASANRIFDIIDEVPEDLHKKGKISKVDPKSNLKLSDVSFSYNAEINNQAPTIKNISFELESGKSIALVGKSGSGKSTIVSLLFRFHNYSGGEIALGGKEISEYSISAVRELFSIVSQNTFLFNDTVFNNISYGNPNASKADILQAAKVAFAHDFIKKLPNGYDTTVGQQGLKLSGGERARISIARAVLKNAPYLILDEATANLDSESEALVHKAIEGLMSDRTSIIIAHRLSTIKNVDQILVMEEGEIIERGSHDELLKSDGLYKKLYSLQV